MLHYQSRSFSRHRELTANQLRGDYPGLSQCGDCLPNAKHTRWHNINELAGGRQTLMDSWTLHGSSWIQHGSTVQSLDSGLESAAEPHAESTPGQARRRQEKERTHACEASNYSKFQIRPVFKPSLETTRPISQYANICKYIKY